DDGELFTAVVSYVKNATKTYDVEGYSVQVVYNGSGVKSTKILGGGNNTGGTTPTTTTTDPDPDESRIVEVEQSWSKTTFHCNTFGGNPRVWPQVGPYNKDNDGKVFLVLKEIPGTTAWYLIDVKDANGNSLGVPTCPGKHEHCGISDWISFSNNSGLPDGKNIQLFHGMPDDGELDFFDDDDDDDELGEFFGGEDDDELGEFFGGGDDDELGEFFGGEDEPGQIVLTKLVGGQDIVEWAITFWGNNALVLLNTIEFSLYSANEDCTGYVGDDPIAGPVNLDYSNSHIVFDDLMIDSGWYAVVERFTEPYTRGLFVTVNGEVVHYVLYIKGLGVVDLNGEPTFLNTEFSK
ncbi:MAG: hypothetical protein FWE86_05460, partial [Oscillospiraceae bacterium]|nr:hypothetical protein [Oscillospiraceae bacterium]